MYCRNCHRLVCVGECYCTACQQQLRMAPPRPPTKVLESLYSCVRRWLKRDPGQGRNEPEH
ncbi:ferredoxin [Methylohalomonas lacus]|uniref:Ferredoxin n=1 Tax=Methylohalomonas lacus TaxID=398773 RepID=A0AAE3HJT9_9GAMM|nr:ferredoxin [Methylohalomonas lacus]